MCEFLQTGVETWECTEHLCTMLGYETEPKECAVEMEEE